MCAQTRSSRARVFTAKITLFPRFNTKIRRSRRLTSRPEIVVAKAELTLVVAVHELPLVSPKPLASTERRAPGVAMFQAID